MDDGLLSVSAACKWASISPRTFRRLMDRGLRVYRATEQSKILVRRQDILEFLSTPDAKERKPPMPIG